MTPQSTCEGCKYLFEVKKVVVLLEKVYNLTNRECRRYPPYSNGFPNAHYKCGEYQTERKERKGNL